MDSTIHVEGTFYVGWVQTNGVRMNLGFDRNRNNQNKIFYRTSGSFTNSGFEGSLMMRPVFVSATDPFASVEEGLSVDPDRAMILFPNPANDAVMIRCDRATHGSMVQCLDATGRLIQQQLWREPATMMVSDLQPGMYVVRVVGPDGSSIAQERLLIQR